jgi:outer membrane biosynthesis protein TonB
MKKLSPFIAALTITALLAGCGGGSGVRFSDLFDESAAAEGTGIQGFALIRAVVILATHEATPHQRQVAEQNGRRAVEKLQARLAREEPAPAPRKPKPKKPVTTAKAAKKPEAKPKSKPGGEPPTKLAQKTPPEPAVEPAPEPEPEPAPTSKPKPAKKLPRIIAIATEKDAKTDTKAAKAIMLFDTHAQKIIGNKVYDIESEPRPGDEVRFETFSTSYIGASL